MLPNAATPRTTAPTPFEVAALDVLDPEVEADGAEAEGSLDAEPEPEEADSWDG